MDALLQRIKGKRARERHHQLAVEHEPLCRQMRQRVGDLGEVSPQRLARLRLQRDLAAVAKRQTAEAVPLGLVLPLRAAGDVGDCPHLHGWIAEGDHADVLPVKLLPVPADASLDG